MTKNAFVFNNVPIKKIAWGRRRGIIHVKIEDEHYNVVFKSSAKLNVKEDVRRLVNDMKVKGIDIFQETSWF